jgi:hypothetical protein
VRGLQKLIWTFRPPIRPQDVPTGAMWKMTEEALGFRLPDDYKALAESYGLGAFDDFLWVLIPNSRNDHLDLLIKGDISLNALKMGEEEVVPHESQIRTNPMAESRIVEAIPNGPHAQDEVFYPWAITDNGDTLYWLKNRGADRWAIVINESRGPRWARFEMATCEFLAALFRRDIRVEVFPDDFPSESVSFKSV